MISDKELTSLIHTVCDFNINVKGETSSLDEIVNSLRIIVQEIKKKSKNSELNSIR